MQVWVGVDEPDSRRFCAPAPSLFPRSKPSGFFTSTWDPQRNSCSWVDFLQARTADPSARRPAGKRVWALQPDPATRLYVIDSLDDFRRLADEFPKRYDNPRNPSYAPDWNQIALRRPLPLHAVHVTDAAIDAGATQDADDHPMFGGWDVESTLWLEWRLATLGCLGSVDSGWRLRPT